MLPTQIYMLVRVKVQKGMAQCCSPGHTHAICVPTDLHLHSCGQCTAEPFASMFTISILWTFVSIYLSGLTLEFYYLPLEAASDR